MRQIINVLFLVCILSIPLSAQVTTTLNPAETYFPVLQFVSPTFGQCVGAMLSGNGDWCFALNPANPNLPTGVPTSLFATKGDVTTMLTPFATKAEVTTMLTPFATKAEVTAMLTPFATKAEVTAMIAPLATRAEVNAMIAPLASQQQVNAMTHKSFRLAAVSAALRDAIPNPGDRFALRLNAAGFSGNLAGALGFSATINEAIRLQLNYGRSKSEGIMSGGLNFSIH